MRGVTTAAKTTRPRCPQHEGSERILEREPRHGALSTALSHGSLLRRGSGVLQHASVGFAVPSTLAETRSPVRQERAALRDDRVPRREVRSSRTGCRLARRGRRRRPSCATDCLDAREIVAFFPRTFAARSGTSVASTGSPIWRTEISARSLPRGCFVRVVREVDLEANRRVSRDSADGARRADLARHPLAGREEIGCSRSSSAAPRRSRSPGRTR